MLKKRKREAVLAASRFEHIISRLFCQQTVPSGFSAVCSADSAACSADYSAVSDFLT